METGLRKAELLGLPWHRVDMSRGVLRLEFTKSSKRREVPMRQAVYDVLAALPGPREGHVWPSGNIRTPFENAVAEAKLDDLHFHDLRHHFASWYIMRGVSLPALQKLLGHGALTMTTRYAHLSPEHLAERDGEDRAAGERRRGSHNYVTRALQREYLKRGGGGRCVVSN